MSMVESIMRQAEGNLKRLNARKRETVPASELVVGVQCGGSDAFSGVTANPAVGFCTDLLVRAGASVLFFETTEVRDGIAQERQSVVKGKSVSVRVDLGGRRIIKKKNNEPARK